ncbi:MAG TPA: serine hydrolase domain-containing protein [Chloroflexota bacterium]|nr:serine hydrolase domain-containing protein [Chloroflexota bacterium]
MRSAGPGRDEELAAAIGVVFERACPPNEPGVAAIVARNGQVIFRRGYGLANVELGVPITPELLFRIGSVTKQFTAVAILMLAEDGMLSLDDDLTRFLPDYPIRGQTITVEHLLTHTSGIKSYTSLPDWPSLWRKDLTIDELVGLFKDQPPDFAPGERFLYNNSGYILLGAIVEWVSGQSYEQFLTERIFGPAGMARTCYDQTARIIHGRVSGYEQDKDGLVNAPYLSMTQPFAAGGLLSSVDDLLRWDEALHGDRLVSAATLERALTSARLNDGTPTGYGYGWAIVDDEGHRVIEHSGGIHGFRSHALRLPDEHVFVAVLANGTSENLAPLPLAVKAARLTIGQPYQDPAEVALEPAVHDAYVGDYRGAGGDHKAISRDGDHLFIRWANGTRLEIRPTSPTEFFVKGDVFTRLRFSSRAHDGAVVLTIQGRSGPATVATREV